MINGMDIRELKISSIRQAIGIVQQDVYLFSGTIFENILYGKLDASRDEVIQAAKQDGAHEFIMRLENGYDTYIGEHGVKLSGGQKQRISIASFFLKIHLYSFLMKQLRHLIMRVNGLYKNRFLGLYLYSPVDLMRFLTHGYAKFQKPK